MKQERVKLLAIIITISYVGAVLFMCLHNFSSSDMELPTSFLGIPMDKVAHFIMFLPFCFVFWFLLCFSREDRSGHVYAMILLLGLFFASITEAMQESFTEERCAEAYDLFSDSLAIHQGHAPPGGLQRLLQKRRDTFPHRCLGRETSHRGCGHHSDREYV